MQVIDRCSVAVDTDIVQIILRIAVTRKTHKIARIDCDGACMVMMLNIAIYNTRPQSHTSYDNHITKLHLAWTLS